jgi:ribosome-binding factor A
MAHSSGSHHPYPRSARVNQILREVISDELVRISDVDDRLGLLTVTGVDTTPDMRQAMVFFDSLSETARTALEERRGQIQGAVNAQTRLKRTPKLSFRADPAVASGEAVEELLRRQRDDEELRHRQHDVDE